LSDFQLTDANVIDTAIGIRDTGTLLRLRLFTKCGVIISAYIYFPRHKFRDIDNRREC